MGHDRGINSDKYIFISKKHELSQNNFQAIALGKIIKLFVFLGHPIYKQ